MAFLMEANPRKLRVWRSGTLSTNRACPTASVVTGQGNNGSDLIAGAACSGVGGMPAEM